MNYFFCLGPCAPTDCAMVRNDPTAAQKDSYIPKTPEYDHFK